MHDKSWGRRTADYLKHWGIYAKHLAKWMGSAALIGLLCGGIGTAFHVGVEKVTELRAANPWLLWLLPAIGLLIAALYRVMGTEGKGTDHILEQVQRGEGLPFLLLPSIFVSTILTHLGGGSAGREGAALQMGGTIGYHTGRLLRLDDEDLRVSTMIGMAAFFSALFGTPLAAAIFTLEVISVGAIFHMALLPCLTAALTAFGVSVFLGVEPTCFAVTAPSLEAGMMCRVVVLAALCALLSVLFCAVIHQAHHLFGKGFPNVFFRIAAGGVMIILLTFLSQSGDYNGAGMSVISRAVEEGRAFPTAFAWKLLFTAVTLGAGYKGGEVVPSFFVGAGYKGGEVVPSFFVGATFGCVVGPLLGIPAGFAAAVGLICVFCGAVNSPLASIFLAVELFGAEGLLYFAMACALSFVLSGYSGLYSSQRILYSKLKAHFIGVQTNAHHEGQKTPEP